MTEPRVGNVGRILTAQFDTGPGFAADRRAITRVHQAWPALRDALSDAAAFEGRLVTAAHNAAITQFVFLGHDFPTKASPVFQAGCLAEPGASRIVVVESDPHTRAAWQQAAQTWFPATIRVSACHRWAADRVLADLPRHGIDLTRPVCVVVGNAATFAAAADRVPDQLTRYRQALPPGSWMALTHLTAEHTDGDAFAAAAAEFASHADAVPISRTHADVAALFGDWALLSPGVCPARAWHPQVPRSGEQRQSPPGTWCGVAARPGVLASLPWPPGVLA